jgi:hypothetical protein
VEVNEGGEVVGIRLPQMLARGVMSSFPLLPSLKVLDLTSNLIEGSLPARLGKLEVLQLGYNMLSGTIPSNWTKSTHLKRLQLGFNSLSGTLPSTIGKMGQLEEFDVASNRFGSSIPSEIEGCTSLQILDLTQNMFDGTIPSEIGNLKHLQYLDLSANSFDEGTLPVELIWFDKPVQFRFVRLLSQGTDPNCNRGVFPIYRTYNSTSTNCMDLFQQKLDC